MGNGDGRLNLGEIFRLGVVLDNWTMHARQVRVEIRWDSELLSAPWEIPSAASGKELSREASLSIGGHAEVLLPSLHLSPQARAGQVVEIEMDVRAGAQQ